MNVQKQKRIQSKSLSISGAILAGGKNKRMGSVDKAFLEVNGAPIIERTLSSFTKIFEEVIIVTNSPEKYTSRQDQYFITEDIFKEIGPLGGIHAALTITKNDAVFISACDMPFINSEVIFKMLAHFQISEAEVLLPKLGQKIHYLHGIYKTNLRNKITSFLKSSSNLAVQSFLKAVSVDFLEFNEDKPFLNINTPEDFEEARHA